MAPGPTSDPYAPVRWDLVPGRTSLLLIDYQNDFLDEEGWYAQSGVDISHMRRTIAPTRRLVAAARHADVPLVWTRHGCRDERDAGTFFELRPFLREGGLRVGTWGYEISAELPVDEGDWFVQKNRLSAFYNTNLEVVLRALDTEVLLVAGVLTNQCIAASSKDATFRDFKPVVVAECTGTTLPHLHEPALEMVKVGWGDVRSVDETVAELDALAARVA
jgi:nicotinamidase-related amidase